MLARCAMALADQFISKGNNKRKQPVAPSEPPPHIVDEMSRAEKSARAADKINTLRGVRADKFAEGFVVVYNEDDASFTDEPTRVVCRTLRGRYFKVGQIGGSPIFRQEAPKTPGQDNRHEVFLSRADWVENQRDRGWYFSLSVSQDDSFLAKNNVLAWCAPRHGEPHTFPWKIFPNGATSREKGLLCHSYVNTIFVYYGTLACCNLWSLDMQVVTP